MKKEERMVSGSKLSTDSGTDSNSTYRPKTLEEFIGQEEIKENLKVYIKAAKARGDSLDHILLHGPPGLGKTTFANIIANELGVGLKIVQAPVLEKTGDIASHLSSLATNDVFFIDEIHRLKPAIEELLYSAMEDFKLDIVIGKGAGAKFITLPLQKFTLIGATTKTGLLTSPFLARFGIIDRLDFYNNEVLVDIVKRTASFMSLDIDDISASEIASRSRGTPRVVNRIMRRVRDFSQVEGSGQVNLEIVNKTLERLQIDAEGLDMMDRRLLKLIIEQYNGGPVGLETLGVSLGETPDTIEDVYEPYLIQKGFLARTPRGRTTTNYCHKYFNKVIENNNLF